MPSGFRLAIGVSLALLATPLVANDNEQGVPTPVPQRLANASGENDHWTGIGRLLVNGKEQCVATLLDTRPDDGSNDGPAYLIGAGHCVSKRNGVIVQDQPLDATIDFNFFADTLEERKRFPIKRIVWSSMQGSDLALLELNDSLNQVMAQGVHPLRLATRPDADGAVQVIGEVSASDQGLNLANCTQWRQPLIVELPWVWRNARSNNCLGGGPGFSGSPVLKPDSRHIISVVNSMAQQAAHAPSCEGEAACQSRPQLYAMPVQRLAGCFVDGRADLGLESCQLLPGFQLSKQGRFNHRIKIAMDESGQPVIPKWHLRFTLDSPRYRYKTTRDPLACEDPREYSGTVATRENLIDAPIGLDPGWHFLCVIGVDSPEQKPSPALMANSLSLPIELLPASLPTVVLSSSYLANGDMQLSFEQDHSAPLRYRVKRGKPETTDCDDPRGYRLLATRQPVLKAAELPVRVCSKAEDMNRQVSPPRSDLFLPRPG